MVKIQVKHGGESQTECEFLYECQSICQIQEIADQIIQISNLQIKVSRLAVELEPPLSGLTGNPKAVPLIRALSEAKSYVSKDQVVHNKALSHHVLKDLVQSVEEEALAIYELLGFQNSNQLQQLFTDVELLAEETTQLHWAGKNLMLDKKLCDYIGTNDKTKIVLRLHQSTSVVPV